MLLRKHIEKEDFQITDNALIVKNDSYPLIRIQKIDLRQLDFKRNIINVISLALMLSAATWAFVPAVGPYMFALTLFLGFFSWKKYELRAEFTATDETGDYWVTIANCRTEHEYQILKNIQSELTQFLCLK